LLITGHSSLIAERFMDFYSGLLNLANWSGNVILPTLAGLFLSFAVVCFSKGQGLPPMDVRRISGADGFRTGTNDGDVHVPIGLE